jgi:hypothetical protein
MPTMSCFSIESGSTEDTVDLERRDEPSPLARHGSRSLSNVSQSLRKASVFGRLSFGARKQFDKSSLAGEKVARASVGRWCCR